MTSTIENVANAYGRSANLNFDRKMPSYHKNIADKAQQKPADPLHFIIRNDAPQVKVTSFAALAFKITGFMAFIAVMFFLAASWYGNVVSKAGHTTDNSIKEFSIGNDFINVPLNMIRFSSQRNAGNLQRLDLYAHWPTIEGYSDALANDFDSLADDSPLLFISIEPRNMTNDMSGRIEGIYNNFFAGPPIDAGNGLVRRAFSAESAYFSEDLYYEANSPYPYAARCIRENDKVAAPFCMRDIHVGNSLTMTYRFHNSLLPQWREVENAVREKISQMLAK